MNIFYSQHIYTCCGSYHNHMLLVNYGNFANVVAENIIKTWCIF